jgi:protein AATF/BFR2
VSRVRVPQNPIRNISASPLLIILLAEHDPEENPANIPSSDDEASNATAESFDGREHYASVSKSTLRKSRPVALGPRYSGNKVARAALDVASEDDGAEDHESEEDVSSGDAERDATESLSDEIGSSDTEESMSVASSDADVPGHQTLNGVDQESQRHRAQAELRDMLHREQNGSATASLAQAKREDIEKGKGVKRQRATYDSFLSTRMKLQKTLVAVNTLVGSHVDQATDARGSLREAYEAAELAAFTLWDSLDRLRDQMSTAGASGDSPAERFSLESTTADLFAHCLTQERDARPARDAVLQKWSKKVQGPILQSDRGRLNQERQATIVDVLQEQLSNVDRLVRKTHAPRSCAPVQSSQRITEDPKIYDDADFYGLLLKELLEQKSHDSVAASSIDIGFQMRRENKTKRNVDTKASKGRKIRYTIQEKLQNFMAPEMRGTWEERQTDELFGSLFGYRTGLAEVDDAPSAEEDFDPLEAGLVMFRNHAGT